MDTETKPGRAYRLGVAPVAAGLALLAAVLAFTWPLPVALGTQVIAPPGADLWQHLWNFGWVRTALLDLHWSPYYTTSLFYPAGAPLAYHSLNLVSAVVSLPFQVVFGLLPAFNLLLLANLLADAAGAYWLARVLGYGRGPAVAAGVIFAWSAPLSVALLRGQSDLVSACWLPLYLGLLFRGAGLRAIGLPPGSRRYLIGAGIVLAASAFASYYWPVSLAIFTLLYMLAELLAARRAPGTARRAWLGRLALTAGVALLFLSPLLFLLAHEQAAIGDALNVSRSPTTDTVAILTSQDLVSLVLPLPGRLAADAEGRPEPRMALGWTVLALVVAAWVARRGAARRGLALWSVAGALFVVLALGPVLQVNDQNTGIPLPYAAILEIPGAAAMRAPDRFLVPATLCLAVLAAAGLAALGARLPSPGWRAAGLALVMVLLAGEYLGPLRPLLQPAVAPFFTNLAAQPSPCLGRLVQPLSACDAVLELPQSLWTPQAMFHVAVDQHPMLSGYLSRHVPDPFSVQVPGVGQLVRGAPGELGPDIVSPTVDSIALRAMDYYGVRYVVVHSLATYRGADRLNDTLVGLFGNGSGTPSGDVRVFTVPHVTQDRAFLYLWENWYDLEQTPTGHAFRWTDQYASVRLVVPPGTGGSYTVTLRPFSASGTRTLVAGLDGREIGRYPIGPTPGEVRLGLTVAPGEHLLTLSSVEPAIQPADAPRPISLGYQAVVLAP